ncbi:MAG: hypothetical protein RMJ15_02735 [Nitrososphaerota archaeon]|nr:hypothetical protein [Candidatus Bathyarchaeota archaeon]MDW8022647.1 hypothetical protein [Nitrososphaerota archaeon]
MHPKKFYKQAAFKSMLALDAGEISMTEILTPPVHQESVGSSGLKLG